MTGEWKHFLALALVLFTVVVCAFYTWALWGATRLFVAQMRGELRKIPPRPSALEAAVAERTAVLREALEEIADCPQPDHWVPQYQHCVDVARITLAKVDAQK